MRGQPGISPIYSMAFGPQPSESERQASIRAIRTKAWHVLGLVILDPREIEGDWERQAVVSMAVKLYGKRT